MNRFDEDNELRRLIKSIKPESPGTDFSSKVMKRVYDEQEEIEKSKSESIFGSWFWIILAAFASLFVIVFLVPENATGESASPDIITELTGNAMSNFYSFIYKTFDFVSPSVAAILIASSLLIIIERLLSSRIRIY